MPLHALNRLKNNLNLRYFSWLGKNLLPWVCLVILAFIIFSKCQKLLHSPPPTGVDITEEISSEPNDQNLTEIETKSQITKVVKSDEPEWCRTDDYEDLSQHQLILAFENWLQAYEAFKCESLKSCAHDPRFHRQLLIDGENIAKERKKIFERIIQGDPHMAIELAIEDYRLARLPEEIQKHTEKWVHDFADVDSIHMCFNPKEPAGMIVRKAKLQDGSDYELFVYGKRKSLPTVKKLAIWGVHLNGKLAISETSYKLSENDSSEDDKYNLSLGGKNFSFPSQLKRKFFSEQIESFERSSWGNRRMQYPIIASSTGDTYFSSYWLMEVQRSWLESNETANLYDGLNGITGKLACVEDDNENELIFELMKRHKITGSIPASINYIWLGGKYDVNSSQWVWVDNKDFNQTDSKWKTGHPKNPPMGALAMDLNDGNWVDLNESNKTYALFEFEIDKDPMAAAQPQGRRKVLVVPGRFYDEGNYFEGSSGNPVDENGNPITGPRGDDSFDPDTREDLIAVMDGVQKFYLDNSDQYFDLDYVISPTVTLDYPKWKRVPAGTGVDNRIFDSTGQTWWSSPVVYFPVPERLEFFNNYFRPETVPNTGSGHSIISDVGVSALHKATAISDDYDFNGYAFQGVTDIVVSEPFGNFTDPVIIFEGGNLMSNGLPDPKFKSAQAVAKILNGEIYAIKVLDNGAYYHSMPKLTIVERAGSNPITSPFVQVKWGMTAVSWVFVSTYDNSDGVTTDSGGGLGAVGAPGSHCTAKSSVKVMAHELGHNFGLLHANKLISEGYNPIGDEWGELEYGNQYSVMGTGQPEKGDLTIVAKGYLPMGYKIGREANSSVDILDFYESDQIKSSPFQVKNSEHNNTFRIYRHDFGHAPNPLSAISYDLNLSTDDLVEVLRNTSNPHWIFNGSTGYYDWNGSVEIGGPGQGANANFSLAQIHSSEKVHFILDVNETGFGYSSEPTIRVLDENNQSVLTIDPSLFPHELRNLTNSAHRGIRGIRLPANNLSPYSKNYFSYRRKHEKLDYGLNVLNGNAFGRESAENYLVDATPNTPGNFDDALLLLGHTFSEYDQDAHITPIAKGGIYPMEYIEVVVNIGTIEEKLSKAPTFNLLVSDSSPAINHNTNFTVVPTSGDEKAYAYSWYINEVPVSDPRNLNRRDISTKFTKSGYHIVKVVVSDMMGGISSESVTIRVGDADQTSGSLLSGKVKSESGPIQGAKVVLQKAPIIEHTVRVVGSLQDSHIPSANSNSLNFVIDGIPNKQLEVHRGEVHRFIMESTSAGYPLTFFDKPDNEPAKVRLKLFFDPLVEFKGNGYTLEPKVTFTGGSLFDSHYSKTLTNLYEYQNGIGPNGTNITKPFAKSLLTPTELLAISVADLKRDPITDDFIRYGGYGNLRDFPPAVVVYRNTYWEDFDLPVARAEAIVDGVGTIENLNYGGSGYTSTPDIVMVGAGKDFNATGSIRNWSVKKDQWWQKKFILNTSELNIKNQGKEFDPNSTLPVALYPKSPFAYWSFDRHESLFDSNETKFQPSPAFNNNITSKLHLYWKCDTNRTDKDNDTFYLHDFSGNKPSNHGREQGANVPTFSWGVKNKALSLTDSNHKLRVNSGDTIPDGNFTVSCWLNALETNSTLGIFENANQIIFSPNMTVGSYTFTPSVQKWFHFATTWNGTNRKIFINGKEKYSDTVQNTNLEFASFIDFLLDEVKVYTRVLTDSEIRQMAGKLFLDLSGNRRNIVPIGIDMNASTFASTTIIPNEITELEYSSDLGDALYLNGSQYLDITNNRADFTTLSVGSYAFWVKPESIDKEMTLFSASNVDDNGSYYRLFITKDGFLNQEVMNKGEEINFLQTQKNNLFSKNFKTTIPSFWHHVVVQITEQGTTIFVNGQNTGANPPAGSKADRGFIADIKGVNQIAIGHHKTTLGTDYFTGSIDEFHFYDRILNNNEITYLINQGITKHKIMRARLHAHVDAVGTINVIDNGKGYQVQPRVEFEYNATHYNGVNYSKAYGEPELNATSVEKIIMVQKFPNPLDIELPDGNIVQTDEVEIVNSAGAFLPGGTINVPLATLPKGVSGFSSPPEITIQPSPGIPGDLNATGFPLLYLDENQSVDVLNGGRGYNTSSAGFGFDWKVDWLDGAEDVISVEDATDSNISYLYVLSTQSSTIAWIRHSNNFGVISYDYIKYDPLDPFALNFLNGLNSIAISPDEKHVYITADVNESVSWFDRDLGTGALTYGGTLEQGVNGVDGLDGASSVTISPDDNHVYVTAERNESVSWFDRNTATGALTYVGSLEHNVTGVKGARGPISLAVSPDGKHAYVTADVNGSSSWYDGNVSTGPLIYDRISWFDRNTATGALTYVGSLEHNITSEGLNGPSSVTISPDDNHVYVTADVNNSVSWFNRNSTNGALTYGGTLEQGVNGVDGLTGAENIIGTNNHIYITSKQNNSVSWFVRDLGTGGLTYVGTLKDGVNNIDGLRSASSISISKDGLRAYVTASSDDTLNWMNRDVNTGALTYVGGIKNRSGVRIFGEGYRPPKFKALINNGEFYGFSLVQRGEGDYDESTNKIHYLSLHSGNANPKIPGSPWEKNDQNRTNTTRAANKYEITGISVGKSGFGWTEEPAVYLDWTNPNRDVNPVDVKFNTTLSHVSVDNPGFGYSVPVKVQVVGGNRITSDPSYAFRPAIVVPQTFDSYSGITSYRIVDPGQGYKTTPGQEPVIRITGGGGLGATAIADINGNGQLASVMPEFFGRGYRNVDNNNTPIAKVSKIGGPIGDETNASVLLRLGGGLQKPVVSMSIKFWNSFAYTAPWIDILDRGRSSIPESDKAEATAKVVDGNITKIIVTKSGKNYIDPYVKVSPTPPGLLSKLLAQPRWKCYNIRENRAGRKVICGHVVGSQNRPTSCHGEKDLKQRPSEQDLIDWRFNHNSKFEAPFPLCQDHGDHLEGNFTINTCSATSENFILINDPHRPYEEFKHLDINCSAVSEDGKIREIVIDDHGTHYYAPNLTFSGTGGGVDAVPVFNSDGKIKEIFYYDDRIRNLEMDLIDRPIGAGHGFTERPFTKDYKYNSAVNERDMVHMTVSWEKAYQNKALRDVTFENSDSPQKNDPPQPLSPSLLDAWGDRVMSVDILDHGSYLNGTSLSVTVLNQAQPAVEFNATHANYPDFQPASLTAFITNRLSSFNLDGNGTYQINKQLMADNREYTLWRSTFLAEPTVDLLNSLGSETYSYFDVEDKSDEIFRLNGAFNYSIDSEKSYFDFFVDERVPNNLYYGLDSSNWYSMGGEIVVKEGMLGDNWGDTNDWDSIAYTDSNGYYVMPDLEPGMYNIGVIMEDEKYQDITFRADSNLTLISQMVYVPGFDSLTLQSDGTGNGLSSLVWDKTSQARSIHNSANPPNLNKVLQGIGGGFKAGEESKIQFRFKPHSTNTGRGTPDINASISAVDGTLTLQVVDNNESINFDLNDKFTVSYASSIEGIDFTQDYEYADLNNSYWGGGKATESNNTSNFTLKLTPQSSGSNNAVELDIAAAANNFSVSTSFNLSVFDENGSDINGTSGLKYSSKATWGIVFDQNVTDPLSNDSNKTLILSSLSGSITNVALYSSLRGKGARLFAYWNDQNVSTRVMASGRTTLSEKEKWLDQYFYSTNYVIASTDDNDSDQLFDYEEWNYRTNPREPDTDDDNLTDWDEIKNISTNPLVADTDNDGFDDFYEHSYKDADGNKPLNPVVYNFLPPPPVIGLLGNATIYANAGATILLGAISSEKLPNKQSTNLTVKMEGNYTSAVSRSGNSEIGYIYSVLPNAISGVYKVNYSVLDSYKRIIQKTQTLIIVGLDSPPTLTLSDSGPIKMYKGSSSINSIPYLTYIKSNPSASDTVDGNLTSKIQISGDTSIDVNQTGEYEVVYSVIDSSKNEVTKSLIVIIEDYAYVMNGKAIDGYLVGSTVVFDAKEDGFDGQHDLAQIITTDSSGGFELQFTPQEFTAYDINGNGIIDFNEGKIIISGGMDVSRNASFTGEYKSGATATVISPLTTLIEVIAGDNPSTEQLTAASQKVATAFGLPDPTKVDPISYDPLYAASIGGDSSTKSILGVTARLASAMNQIDAIASSTSLNSGSAASVEFINKVAIELSINDSSNPLESVSFLGAAIDGSLKKVGSGVSPTQLDDAVAIMTESDTLLKNTVDSDSNLTTVAVNLAKNQLAVQSEIIDEYQSLVGGSSLTSIRNSSTREKLSQVSNAIQTINVFPPVAQNFQFYIGPDSWSINSQAGSVSGQDGDPNTSISYEIISSNFDLDKDGIKPFIIDQDGKVSIGDKDDLSPYHGKTRQITVRLSDGQMSSTTIGTVQIDNFLSLSSKSTNGPDGWLGSDWMGNFYSTKSSWVYHSKLGWLYIGSGDSSGYWIWHNNLQIWWWTKPSVFPYFYNSKNIWNYWDLNSNPIIYYNFDTKKWNNQ
jgi:6-phosphogluconolactonase (cycloisomerase 2 family)